MKTLFTLLIVVLLAGCAESNGPDFDRSIYTFGEYDVQITDARDTYVGISSSDKIPMLVKIILSVDGKEIAATFCGWSQQIDLKHEFSYIKILKISPISFPPLEDVPPVSSDYLSSKLASQ